MQKNTLSHIIREEVLRAGIFALSFFVFISLGFVGIAYAAESGGLFGQILNKIVASGDWTTSDGTVKNAKQLGGTDASEFVRIHPDQANRSCGKDTKDKQQCIAGFDTGGVPICVTP